MRRYFVDFWILVQTKDEGKKRFMVEIKPHCQIQPPTGRNKKTYLKETQDWIRNQDKWKAATIYAKQNRIRIYSHG